jgi:nickel/cobalt exporter
MDEFARLLAQGPGTALLYLPVAFAIGALHAMEPGHSKSLMAGFVVATRGTPASAVLLGLSAAVAHSLVVWALVAAGLLLRDAVLVDRALPWLTLAGGLLTIGIGAWTLRRGVPGDHHHHGHHHHHHHHHDHDHGHDHGHDHHHHHHAPAGPVGWRATMAFGLTAGLVPCPAAIAVLFLCLNAGATLLGVATVGAFSLGLAAVLVGVGLAASLALSGAGRSGRLAAWADGAQRVAPWLTLAVGFYLTARAIMVLS